MAAGGHFGSPKFTFDRFSGRFRSIHNFNLFLKFLTKWLPSAILYVKKFTLDHIYDDFRSIKIFFLIFLQNGCGGHFVCPKITFDRISSHFRSIRSAILDFRNSLSIAILAISDQYRVF